MVNSQLIELLQTFERKEWIEATKFVQSPFHNSRSDVVKLLEYLKKVVPRGQVHKLDKARVFEAIYPLQTYDEKTIRYTMSFLFRLLQEYLAYNEFKEEELLQQLSLLKALRKRGLDRTFEGASHKTAESLASHPYRNQDYYYHAFSYHEEQYIFSTTKSRSITTGFQHWSDQSTLFFMVQKLQQACIALSHQTVLKNTYQLPLFDAVLKEIAERDYHHCPAILVYHQLYQTLSGKEDDLHFLKLKTLIVNFTPYFPKHEVKSIYLFALNFCIQQWNAGKSIFLQHAFTLYKEGLTAGIFIENGHLSRFTYNNIALAGMGSKAFEWTENFLKTYEPFIEEKYRYSTFNFNLATLYYRKQDYHKAMHLLQQTDFQDVLHSLEARKMLLIIYYELGENNALESLLESFKNLVYRQKKIGYHRENYLNLIRFTHKRLRLNASDKQGMAKLRTAVKTTPNVAEREWLLQKME
ncbi:MAG: hypothetical protein R2828_19915 [Saprospiraceae bacterium]